MHQIMSFGFCGAFQRFKGRNGIHIWRQFWQVVVVVVLVVIVEVIIEVIDEPV